MPGRYDYLKSDDKKGNIAMTKKKEIPLLIEGLRRISANVTALADALEGTPSTKDNPAETESAKDADSEASALEAPAPAVPDTASAEQHFEEIPAPVREADPTEQAAPAETINAAEPETLAYTFADVRKILADKSRKGYTDKVKAIITAHGADRLSDIPESDYAAVVAEAEALDG
jgi:hypothetical protein